MDFLEVTNKSTNELVKEVINLLVEEMIIVKGREGREAPDEKSLEEHVSKAFQVILADDSPAHVFSLLDDGRPVAVCLANLACGVESGGWYLWVNEIYVTPNERKKGIGKLMANSVLDWAEKRGCRYIAGITWKGNHASQQLFKSCGFQAEEILWLDKDL